LEVPLQVKKGLRLIDICYFKLGKACLTLN
jgi:hypothetical protein